MSVSSRLALLGITLPPFAPPAAAYVPFVRTGKIVHLSGHIARKDGAPWMGQLGITTDTAEGWQAARAIAVELLSTLQAAAAEAGTTLDAVQRIVKVVGLVNASSTYTEPHLVMNGCSELLAEVFGARGAHARSAFCVSQLPMGACVEIELIAEFE